MGKRDLRAGEDGEVGWVHEALDHQWAGGALGVSIARHVGGGGDTENQ
jgi:hypothetical protein